MPAPFEETLLRIPMSFDEYLRLPEKPRAEWVDGVALIMSVPPGFHHGLAMLEVGAALRTALPEHYVAVETYLRLPGKSVRLPDVMLTDRVPEHDWVSEPPLMVAEVLSRSTRSEDLVAKLLEYAEGGIGQYWILDPDERTLEVLSNVDGAWATLAIADDASPEVTVVLAGVAVPVDLRQLLRN